MRHYTSSSAKRIRSPKTLPDSFASIETSLEYVCWQASRRAGLIGPVGFGLKNALPCRDPNRPVEREQIRRPWRAVKLGNNLATLSAENRAKL